MPYVLKMNKRCWAPEGKLYREGFSCISNHPSAVDIKIFDTKEEALLMRKVLRKKYCAFKQIRIVDMSNSSKLEILTYVKLKYRT